MPIANCKDNVPALGTTFDELILLMFDSRYNLEGLEEIQKYIIKYKYQYCPLHISTLTNCIKGYIENCKNKI